MGRTRPEQRACPVVLGAIDGAARACARVVRHLGRTLTLGLLLGMTAASLARAADPETERARALFEEAGELERHGQWSAAQDRLRAALRLRETPQLYYAFAWSLENDDKLLEAKTEYETAARLGRERTGAEEVVRLAMARLAELEKTLPVIRVRVAGGARSNARVIVDGRVIKRDDDLAATPVNPGSHVIRVERGTAGDIEQMVYVGRSTVRTVEIEADSAVTERNTTPDRHIRSSARSRATTMPATVDSRSSDLVPWLLVTGGITFVAAGVGLLLSAGADAESRDSAQARWCAATSCVGNAATRAETLEAARFRQDASDAASTGNTKQAIGFAIGGAGLVATTVGAILLLSSDERPEKPAPRARAHADATALPGGGFASATFSF